MIKPQRNFVTIRQIHRTFAEWCEKIPEKLQTPFGAVQKRANLVDVDKCCKMTIELYKSALIHPRAELPKVGLPVYRSTGTSTARSGIS